MRTRTTRWKSGMRGATSRRWLGAFVAVLACAIMAAWAEDSPSAAIRPTELSGPSRSAFDWLDAASLPPVFAYAATGDSPQARLAAMPDRRTGPSAKVLLLAQGEPAAQSVAHAGSDTHEHWLQCPDCKSVRSASLFVRATPGVVQAGVEQSFSTWSDLTAVFRPSRWRHGLQAGGALSWLNANAWREAPGRTAKVLAGELILAGAVYAAVESGSGSGRKREQAPAHETVATESGARPSNGSAGGGSGGDPGGGSGGGDDGDDDDQDEQPMF